MDTLEVAYRVGEFEFIQKRNLLIKGNKQQKLEQMQADILMVFINNQKSIVTRELLEEEVWGGRFVAEQAINNKISELRKLFGDDYRNPIYFKTHHKLGYELIANSQQIKKDEEEKPLITNSPSIKINKKLWACFAFATILFTFINVRIFKSINNEPTKGSKGIVNFLPITSEKGQEWAPNLSSDGKYLAYSHRLDNFSNWKLVIKNIDTNETSFVTQGLNNSLSPLWAPYADTLYFIKNINKKCTIWQANQVLTKPKMTQLTECGDIPSMSPLAIGPAGEWLYFSNNDSQPKFTINRFNLLNHTTETLTAPPVTGIGDYTLALSPNGRFLVFLRAATVTKSELMLLNIDTRELSFIKEFNHKIYKLAWNHNNDEIIYIDKNNTLVAINIVSKITKSIVKFQNKSLAPYFTNDKSIYLIDGDFFVSDIYSVNLSTEQEELNEQTEILSSYQDYDPTIGNNKETIAFTSNRNGMPQIWFKNSKKMSRLTDYQNFSYITDKHFSPDEKSLLFLRDNVPFILDIDSKSISKPLIKIKHSASPIWACDGGSVLVSSQDNGAWNLYQINIKNLEVIKKFPHVRSIKSDCSTSSYYVMFESKKGLYQLSNDMFSATEVLPGYHSVYSRSWQINEGNLFILNNAKLTKVNLQSDIASSIKMPVGNINSFILFDNRMFFSRRYSQEMHIKQLVKSDY